jgi:DNA-binding CsgD family transcriptional regulator
MEGPMGEVEHLKTLCCLGLPPESAMVALTPLLNEIIPHGGTRISLLAPDATITSTYAENPATEPLFRDRFWRFMDDPSALASLWIPGFRAVAIGWTIHRQGGGYLQSGYYREIEAPLDSCWILSGMIGDSGKSIAHVTLTRHRSARPFTVDDVRRLDRLRPWLAHAFRRSNCSNARQNIEAQISAAGSTVLSGQVILTADAKIVFQTPGIEQRLGILLGEPGNFTRRTGSEAHPADHRRRERNLQRAAAHADFDRLWRSALEAKWLMPMGTLPADAARDPKSCLIAVTIDLHEHPIAHAARVLRESGATPTQTKVGIQLALGKAKPAIADELGIQLCTVADLTRRLYQTLDVHNSAELATKIWLDQRQVEARQNLRRAGQTTRLRLPANGSIISPVPTSS